MKKVNFLVTGRFFIVFSVSLAIGFGTNWFNHKSYYATRNGVQSVDLNILTNTLPTKLSDSLKRKDFVEIQRTISSNYGFFGLVVTDCNKSEKYCENQKILAISQPAREGWREKVRPENLVQFQYDILRDSLPITSEWQFNNDEAMSVIPTGRENKGKPIGRVYYIRRDPPTLIQNHLDWILIPIESFQIFRETGDLGKSWKTLSSFWGSGANKYYSLTYLLCLVTASLIWRIWEENTHQKEQVVYQKNRFDNLSKQTNRVISNLGNQIQNLQGELQQVSVDAEYLKTKLIDTENLLEGKNRETSSLVSQVKILSNDLDISEKDKNSYKIKLDSANKNIQDTLSNIQILEDNLKIAESFKQGGIHTVEKLRQDISNAYKYIDSEKQVASKLGDDLEKAKLNYTSIQQKLNNAENNLDRNQDEINSLNQKLKNQSDKQQEYLQVIQELRLKNQSLVDQQVNLQTKNESLKSSLSKRSEKLREELRSEYDAQVDSLCNSLDRDILEKDNKIQSLIKENESLKILIAKKEKEFIFPMDINFSDSNTKISCVADALQIASKSFPILEIWDSAWESVNTINNYQPKKVYEKLEILANVGEQYFNKSLGNNLMIFLKNYGINMSPESSSTMGEFGRERTFRNKGQSKQMSNHLKIGLIRIYIEFDDETRKVQIGYCGKHLPTSSSS